MSPDWAPLRAELAAWRAAGLALPLWWRDDDATAPTPALERLLHLAESLDLPVHLAVIPEPAKPSLAKTVADSGWAIPLVHGWAHRNHAPAGQKKAEFGQPRAGAEAETGAALARLRALFGDDLLEIFVPPWNRMDPGLAPTLAAQGYCAVSTYAPRHTRHMAGLARINTHIDPVHWKAGGGLVQPEQIIAALVETLRDRRRGEADRAEPLGFLSHHLVHDAAIWDFAEACLRELLDGGAEPCHLRDMKGNLP